MRRIMPITVLAGLLTIAGAASAKDKTFYSNGEIERIITKATENVKHTGVQTSEGYVETVHSVEGAGANEWKVMINGAWGVGDNTIRTVTYPGLIRAHGSRLEFLFLGQPVYQARFAQQVYDHKGPAKARRSWAKKHKDVEPQTGVEDGRLYLTYIYDFTDGVDDGDIENRLKYYFRAASGILIWTERAWRDVKKEHLKKIRGKIDYLEKGDIPLITEDDDWGDYEVDVPGVGEGAWHYSYADRSIRLYNYGDSVLVKYRHSIGSLTDEAQKTVLEDLNQWLERNQVRHAELTEARYDDDRVTIVARYHFDGSLKGEDFAKSYWNFMKKQSAKIGDEIEDLSEDLVGDVARQELTELKGEQLLMILEEDLSELAGEHAEADDFWEFTYHDRTFEVLNYGDHVIVSCYFEMPEVSEADKAKVLQAVGDWVVKHDAKEATRTTAQWYPEYEGKLIWVTAIYELGDGMTGEKIHEGYWHFCDDYSEDAEKQFNKAVSKL